MPNPRSGTHHGVDDEIETLDDGVAIGEGGAVIWWEERESGGEGGFGERFGTRVSRSRREKMGG